MVTIALSVDSEIYTKLSRLAGERGLSVGLYVKELIKEHLKVREALEAGGIGGARDVIGEIEEVKKAITELQELDNRVADDLLSLKEEIVDMVGDLGQIYTILEDLKGRIAKLEELLTRLNLVKPYSTTKG